MKKLTLYTTSDCHLCDQAMALIRQLPNDELTIKVVDIAYDDELLERYGVRIPVVELQGHGEDLGWPFDLLMLSNYLAQA